MATTSMNVNTNAAARRPVRKNSGRYAQASDDLEAIANQVAFSSLDSESGDSPAGCQVKIAASLQQEAAEKAAALGPIGKGAAPGSALFHLPTPGRSSRNPPPPPPAEPPVSPTGAPIIGLQHLLPPPPANPPVATAPPTAAPSSPPVLPPTASPAVPAVAASTAPKGPEPWMAGAQGSESGRSASKGNYREWLQARGAQAMNRSVTGTPTAASSAPANPAVLGSPIAATSPTAAASPLATQAPTPTAAAPFSPFFPPQQPAPVAVPPQPAAAHLAGPPQMAAAPPSQAAAAHWGVPHADVHAQQQQQWYPPQPEVHAGMQVSHMMPGAAMPDYVGQTSPMSHDGYSQMMGPQVPMMPGQQSPYSAPYGQVQYMPEQPMMQQHHMMQQPAMAHQMYQQVPQQPHMAIDMACPWTEGHFHQQQPTQQLEPAAAEAPKQGQSISHQDMMSTLMCVSGGAMNPEQLAEQLKAAAQCAGAYED
eukprot:TRINITY_DN5083_c0_g1_i1.p1 TRINITY_DN5083_c0_g1~~TRINITY_DN5083_c0_g1_i1.p1  ORF type:complete len:479 (-),score=179.21 TRINITY_DN5083_c0_g1_i1:257-1693(-)